MKLITVKKLKKSYSDRELLNKQKDGRPSFAYM